MAKKYVGVQTLEAFMQIVKDALGGKADLVDLQALKETIDNLLGGEGGEATTVELYKDLLMTLDGYDAETDSGKAVAGAVAKALKDAMDAAKVETDAALKEITDKLASVVGETKTPAEAAKEALEAKGEELKEGQDEETQAAIDAAVEEGKAAIDAAGDDPAAVQDALNEAWDKVNEAAGVTEGGDTAPDVTNPVTKVALAEDSERLGGQLPEYYATKEDLKTSVDDQKGVAGGIAELGEDGKVPAEQLPSYVDDVVEGYKVEATEGEADDAVTTITFYEDEAHETAITGEKGKIYIDLHTNSSWRWSGSTYVEVSGSQDMVAITADELQEMWDAIVAENAAEEETVE